MKYVRSLLALLAIGLVLVTGSCAPDQSPTGVSAPITSATDTALTIDGAQRGLFGELLRPTGLLKCSPLPASTATKVIGPDGGTIQVGPHTLVIPAGALEKNVTITATAPSDDVNAVQFSPEGLEFDRPAWLTMSYANCNLLARLLPKRIAYTSNLLDVLYYILSLDNIFTKQVIGKVDHFSKYAVSW